MIRAELLTADVIWPNVALLRAVEGCPHWNQLKALKASALISMLCPFENRNSLVSAASTFFVPGPLMLLRCDVPSVPAAGIAKANGFRNLMPPFCGLLD